MVAVSIEVACGLCWLNLLLPFLIFGEIGVVIAQLQTPLFMETAIFGPK